MSNEALRNQLTQILDWDNAHIRFDDAVKDFPRELRGRRPAGGPHSAWELLEHLRIAQSDILGYARDENHASPAFPEGYWPASPEPPSDEAWDASVNAYRAELRAFEAFVRDESIDLFRPNKDGKTPLREILLAADHNAYHLGQLVIVKRSLAAG